MKRLTCIIALLALATQSAFALLSPLDQNLKELKAIIDSPELKQYIKTSEVIEYICHQECLYMISTNEQEMFVEVEYQPTDRLGPIPFNLIFHKPNPKGS
ncbi:MAG: hypothetical protein KR126chlam2_00291 [Chlamydiae bacterium]|nr:hypothetical protein [Chlamydiota bacterium]